MSECLTEQQLENLASGHLDESEAALANVHLAACAECQQGLNEWKANAAFVARFAGALPRSKPPSQKSNGSKPPAAGATQIMISIPGAPRVDSLPGYTIIREIHRGGQGVVYEAIQRSTRRTVALKVMIDGPFASERARWRFEREVRLIASLKHANIVVVHDSGVSEDRHYFAMDYVAGQPLDEYIRSRKLPPRETVQLFQQVCDAVSYAHRHGVIHRDLKPSNILVNEEGKPFVLDFGLAKATGDEMLESMQGLVSAPGHLMGTLRYMSPEQTSGKPEEIDVRTDVYSLGVILYELLTGTTPYETTKADITTAIRNIRESDPPRITKKHRHIGSELEAITLKALEKEPQRRYQSAGALGEDLAAWLLGRPVVAKSASSLYVIRKLAVRHWYNTTIVGALVIVVVSFSTLLLRSFINEAQAVQRSDTAEQQLTNIGQSLAAAAKESVKRDLLGWFLMEWHDGRIAQAQELAQRFRTSGPERLAADYLLSEDYPADQLVAQMPPSSKQLAYFVIGERAARTGQRPEAIQAFRQSAILAIQAHTDELILTLANGRLVQLGAAPVSSIEKTHVQGGNDVTRKEG